MQIQTNLLSNIILTSVNGIWESYFPWWIGTIIGAALIAFVVAIYIFISDIDIDDFFGCGWIVLVILPAVLIFWIPAMINGWIGINWVIGLILLGGLVAVFFFILLVFLIKFIIEEEFWLILLTVGGLILITLIVLGFIFWLWWAMLILIGGVVAVFLSILLIFLIKFIIEAIQDRGIGIDYEECTVMELKEYCRLFGIKGYSNLKKDELISLLEADDSEDSDDELEVEKPKRKSNGNNTQNNNNHIPTIKLTDIAGLDEAKKALEERVILPLKHKDLYAKYGKKVGGGILLFGLPGTGKTMFAQAVATELDAKFFSVKCSDIESKWTGEAERNVKKLFSDAKRCARAVIFFDEFDSLGRRRSAENESGSNTVQEILTQMQGVETHSNMLLVIAATNCPWALDGALLRPGRFNEKIYIPLPDKAARLFILQKGLKSCVFSPEVNLEALAERLDGFNGADIVEVCEKIKMLLIRKEIAKEQSPIITSSEIEAVLSNVKSSVLIRDIENMEKFLENNG